MNLRYFLFRFSSMVDDNQTDKKSRCIAKLANSNKILPLEFSNPPVLIIKKEINRKYNWIRSHWNAHNLIYTILKSNKTIFKDACFGVLFLKKRHQR